MDNEKKQLKDEELDDEIYQKYIGKYEQIDEEEEIEEEDKIIEEISEFSDEEIDTFVNDLKNEMISTNFKTNSKINELSYKIAKNSKEYLDYNTYMWVMYAFAMKYKDNNLMDPMKYCFVRMRDVLDKKNGNKEFPKALTMVDSSLTDSMNNTIVENTGFIAMEKKNIFKKSIQMEIVMFMMMIFMMSFVFKTNILTSVISAVVMVYITYRFTKYSLEKAFTDTLLSGLKTEDLDDVVVTFDLPVKNS